MKETTTATPDQALESSNQQSLEDLRNEGETTELQDIAVALHELQQAPVPLKKTTISIIPSTKGIIPTAAPLRTKHRFSTIQPIILTTPQFFIPNRHQTFNKINPYKHIKGYEYYEDSTGILGSIPEHSKVLLHPNGVIECLDQGNFPHPISCKKFIYCAKMESTKVLGWEYTCPKGLSFDPIGGMCNWSADLGCNE